MKENNEKIVSLTGVSAGQDPFADLSRLAINQNYDQLTATVDFVHVPIKKPNKQSFIRVSPRDEHRISLAMLELNSGISERELFVVLPEFLPAVADLPGLSNRLLVLCVARPENSPFLWPIKVPTETTSRRDTWAMSAMEAARRAMREWVRVTPNMQMGCYTIHTAKASWPEPTWPELSMNEMLKRALGEKGIIQGPDHPAVVQLRGEA